MLFDCVILCNEVHSFIHSFIHTEEEEEIGKNNEVHCMIGHHQQGFTAAMGCTQMSQYITNVGIN